MHGPSSRVRKNLAKGALPLGILASAAMVWQSSYAAFSGTTSNANNSFTAGTVSLTDNHSGSALLTATALKPGDTGTGCITVTYGGSLAAATKLYVKTGDLTTSTPANLAPYLTLKVEEGSVTGPGCTGFAPTTGGATFNAGSLDTFAGSYTNFATGWGSWAPVAGNTSQTQTYRFTWTVQDNNAAQGLNATVKFTWEAQNT